MTKEQLENRISPELIGNNASFQNGIYADDFINQINRKYSLNEILGKKKDLISVGNWNALFHFTMDTLLQNTEGENILRGILYVSSHADKWQPKIINVSALSDTRIDTVEEYLKAFKNISPTYNKGMMDGGTIFGISVANRGGFVHPITYQNKVIVLPSQEFVEYCALRKQLFFLYTIYFKMRFNFFKHEKNS